ncbi:MAG: lysophospholipid acyltransferase family protein [Isosphaeraceae bacterium]
MKKRRPALDYLVYLAIRAGVGLIQALTIEQSYAIARGLALVLYLVDRRHRAVAIDNLTHAYGDRYSPAERDRIVLQVYEHFCMLLMEIVHIPRKLHVTNWRDRITLKGHGPVIERLLDGGPVIMLTPHFGNWEMAGYLFGVFGFPPYSVARTLDNPHLDRFLRRFRERTGQKLIPKKGGYDDMLAVLKSGGVLSFLADQDAGQNGLYVEFFGRQASTHKAIALLAIEYRTPVVVGCARRIGPGFRYEVSCDRIIDPAEWEGRADDVRWLTQEYTSALEMAIRQAPEQYLWLHRRWKHQPKPRGRKAREKATGESAPAAGPAIPPEPASGTP